MRMLYITQGYPAPEMVGGQISSYYRIAQLTKAEHEVTCLCLVPQTDATTDSRQLKDLCRVVPVRDVPRTTIPHLAANLLDPLPWPIRRYASRAAAATATELVGDVSPDLVLFNSLHSAPLLPTVREVTDVPCLLFSPNVQSTIMRLFADFQQAPHARLFARHQWRKMRDYEREQIIRFDAVCVYSTRDADGLRALAPDAPIEITPITLDIDAIGTPEEPEFDALMTGSFDWPPNADSLAWFLREVHPRILERRPGTTVNVVGPGSQKRRGPTARPGVTFVGRVDDIAPFFRTARVLLVPLRIGSGVRVKIVQAFGSRLPVVSTAKGCEGLDAKSGTHLLMAEEPGAFAEAVARVLNDSDLRRSLAREGRILAERTHDALAPDRPLVQVCERLAGLRSEGNRK